jgi:cyclohexyl-isocyanide hydratase
MEHELKRREFFDLLGRGAAALTLAQLGGCADNPLPEDAVPGESEAVPESAFLFAGEPKQEHIAMLLYPGMTLLDLVGPHTCFLGLGMKTHLVWKTLDPIVTDTGITIMPTTTFADCPHDLALLFVGGSSKSNRLVLDRDVVDFLRSRAETAKLVTSVCTGSLILGGAGLLRGYKATSHWTVRDQLRIVGAQPVAQRYVQDRNRITGAGVTSGIDFGLRVVEQLAGRTIAEATQLGIEYDPEPPFNAGSPDTAPWLVTGVVLAAWAAQIAESQEVLEQARANF